MNGRDEKLLALLEMLRDIELAKLVEISAKSNSLQNEARRLTAALAAARRPDWSQKLQNVYFDQRTRQKWEEWLNREITEVNHRAALLEAEIGSRKNLARKALGRADAFKKLIRIERELQDSVVDPEDQAS